MKKLPALAVLGLITFQAASVRASQGSTAFNCVEDLPANYQQFKTSPIIITGSVEAVGKKIKLRVYGIISKPVGALIVPSDIVEVLTATDKVSGGASFTVGSNVLIFASPTEDAQGNVINELEHVNVKSDLETTTSEATQQLNLLNRAIKDAAFCGLLKNADAVVFGKVTCVTDGGSMAYGRHLANWNKANVFVTESLKGVDAGRAIQVKFPVSLSPVWKQWPSFVAGEETALILKKLPASTESATPVYVAQTLSSKISLDAFDSIRATATIYGIKLLTGTAQTTPTEGQCLEGKAEEDTTAGEGLDLNAPAPRPSKMASASVANTGTGAAPAAGPVNRPHH